MQNDHREITILGLADGLCSAIGVVLGLEIAGQARGLVIAAVALAVGAGTSMAASQWLSEPDTHLHHAMIMGAATLGGAILPAVPFFVLSGASGYVACGVLSALMVAVIAHVRPGPFWASLWRTAAVLGLAAGFSVGASVIAAHFSPGAAG